MYSAQQVRAKSRSAVRRREDEVEQEEVESGELNLIPYLDIVTNLMLFLLASVTSGIILGQINTTLPDKSSAPASSASDPKPDTNPDEVPLQMVLSVQRERVLLWSISGLEGTLAQPKKVFALTGDPCDGPYMCESNNCKISTKQCEASTTGEVDAPVFDYRAINAALFEIADRHYSKKHRNEKTYVARLMADPTIPYSTIISMMGAMRCKLPELGKESEPCLLPTADEELKKAPKPIDEIGHVYDTARADYDPNKMALFHDILFSSGFE